MTSDEGIKVGQGKSTVFIWWDRLIVNVVAVITRLRR